MPVHSGYQFIHNEGVALIIPTQLETHMSKRPAVPARTVQRVITGTHPDVAYFLHRENEVNAAFVLGLVNQATLAWQGRRPKLIGSTAGYPRSDLDLLSFLVPLAARKAVIELPQYAKRRPGSESPRDRHIGDIRFGTLSRLISSQDGLSFSIEILDQSVVREGGDGREVPGAYRRFMLVDATGAWQPGWQKLSFKPTASEAAFLGDCNGGDYRTVVFKHYVHPNRRQSIFGAPYLTLKMLLTRLRDEMEFYSSEMDRLAALGISVPYSDCAGDRKQTSSAKKTKQAVTSIEVELDMPSLTGEYVPVTSDDRGMQRAKHRYTELRYSLIPMVQFVTRADEIAYLRSGEPTGFIAHWAKPASWEAGYRLPRGRKVWKRLSLGGNYALRYRTFSKAETVTR